MSRRFRWTLLAIVTAGAAIRLFRLDHFSYGLDEILQTYWINGSWAYLWKAIRFDAFHPPLDYVVDRLVEPLRPTDAARKLLPVVWGTGTIAVFGCLLARRAGEAAGLVGAALLALAPWHVRYSQELRPYALALLLLCASLLLLVGFLERPNAARLALLYLASLATAYTLYLAAVVLALAAATLVVEDAFSPDPVRRRASRRFAMWSPAFVAAVVLAYLPWWPVLREAMRRPPMAEPVPTTFARAGRILGFFAFAPDDGHALGWGTLFVALVVAGLGIALAGRGRRFVAVWGVGGLVVIETLGRLHPHFDFARRFLPAGPGLTALAALALGGMLCHPAARLPGAAVLAAALVLDVRGLTSYFREGRADWRPLGAFLRHEAAPEERIFTENQYAQLCVAYYVVGPRWLSDALEGRAPERSVINVEGDARRFAWAWRPGSRAWLVLAGEPTAPSLRRWASAYPSQAFPPSERAVVHRLDPLLRRPPAGDPAR